MNSDTPWRTARRMMALSEGNQWYRIRNQTDGPSQLHIYDEIGMLGVSASDLISDLENINGVLEVHLNSPGGEVFEGLGIYNALLQVPKVIMYIDGLAASIASVIALAGTTIKIAKSGRMMVHDGFTMGIGNAQDMRELADRLDFESDNIAQIYADHCGGTQEQWREIMRGTKWYNADQAIDAGLAHEVIDTRVTRATRVENRENSWDLSIYQDSGRSKVPAVRNRAEPPRNAAIHPWHSETDTSHEPMTGRHAHNHAAFGYDDHDDGIHHHAHDHNGDSVHEHSHTSHSHNHSHDGSHRHAHDVGQEQWGPHDHTHTHSGESGADHDDSGPVQNSADTSIRNSADLDDLSYAESHLALHNAAYDGSSWDGPAAMKAAGDAKNPASAFRAICAGRRSGPADERGSWALPHHKSPGSPPNKAGVNNALARLSGTQGLTNKSAAEAHLKAHQAAWDGGDDSDSDSKTSDQADTVTWTAPSDQELDTIMNALRGEN